MLKCEYCEGAIYDFDHKELGHADIPIFWRIYRTYS